MASAVTPLSADDLARARAVAPIIRFAINEPFLPSRVGITVFAAPGRSPSTPFDVTFEPGVARAIEYAIWWDWDIQHLYELEHIWLKLDASDRVVAVEASAHGGRFAMRRPDGELPIEDGRVTLYSAPGKHAFEASAAGHEPHRRLTSIACEALAGHAGILVNEMFADALTAVTPEDHRAVHRWLDGRAFTADWRFEQRFDLATVPFVSWPELAGWIPTRVTEVLAEVRQSQPLIKAVLLDSGDTLVDESTEVFDAEGNVATAQLIPGARAMVDALVEAGYPLALVADGRVRSFANVLGGHGIDRHFSAQVISETAGCQKPDRRMFETALTALGLSLEDAGSVVMVGNHLERDIGGANRLGIQTIWQSWSHRRTHTPTAPEEVPDYTIGSPGELPALLAQIERQMGRKARNPWVGKPSEIEPILAG